MTIKGLIKRKEDDKTSMENNEKLTTSQMRKLRLWSKDLSILLDQNDFNNISKIFKNAVERQLESEGYNEIN